jgi:tetratricopeptide (TPR) repeat protein
MKGFVKLSLITTLGIFTLLAAFPAKTYGKNYSSKILINRIDGIVWDPNRSPVSDVYVELQNELYSTLDRVRTNSSGRFSFTVTKQGNYLIKVLASGTNYLDATERVEIVNVTQTASDNAYVDIYLKYDKRKLNVGLTGVTEAVFVQNVPDKARQLYENAVKNFSKNNEKGFEEGDEALKIFPDYYDALITLGQEYIQRKEYQKSVPYLIKAIDINTRSFSAYYSLGYAAFQLNRYPEAKEAARAATILQPKSVNAQLLYGTLLRLDGNFENAEKVLLQAKSLSKEFPIAAIHWQLALLYNRLKRNSEAVDELQTYLKILPNADNKKEIKDLIEKLRNDSNKQKSAPK